jgi:retinol dehydrogenase 12
MKNKICLITGATQGIGRETARGLAAQGAQVIIVGRNLERTQETVAWIKNRTDNHAIDFILADLSEPSQVRSLADTVKKKFSRLDVLVNNAGGVYAQRQLNSLGLEYTWALNHLSYFGLSLELLDLLKESEQGRIVNVTSQLHFITSLKFDDLMGEKRYNPLRMYAQSKLANVLFTFALARKFKASKITSNCVHPGGVNSNIGNNNDGLIPWFLNATRRFLLSPEQGAQTSIFAASSPLLLQTSGKYFSKSSISFSAYGTRDENIQNRLWDLSLEQFFD